MSSNPSPAVAAFLSFVFPGLGQVYAGEPRRGVIWAIPMFLFILGVIGLFIGGQNAITNLLTTQKTLALLILNVAFLLYHLAAMFDAYGVAQSQRYETFGAPRAAPVALAVLIVATLLLHGAPGVYGLDFYNFLVSSAPGRPSVIPNFSLPPRESTTPGLPTPTPTATPPGGTVTPGSSGSTGSGNPTPSPTARACPAIDLSGWAMAADGRVNLLLVGSDSRSDDGVSEASLRTDSMMLLSIDVASCKGALFSFPRNMQVPGPESRYPSWFHVTLENGQEYPGFLFGLWRQAAASPAEFPGSEGIGSECQNQFTCERGWRALTGAIQFMAGVQVDGVISVNLKGFVDLVKNLPGGGVWLDIPSALDDDAYFNSQQQLMPVHFEPGCQFLNAEETLAYSRSRHQDSDYQRARRQQYVLTQVRKQLDPLALLPNIPGLLQAAQANLFMTVADTDIPFLAQVASRIDADRLYRYDFAPARMTRLESMDGMRDKVINIFSEPEPAPTTKPNDPPCPPRN